MSGGRVGAFSLRKAATVAAALLIGLCSTGAAMAAIEAEAEWILTSQLPDGAIAQYPDFTRINPYLGNYAAMGLVRAWTQTGNTAYVDAAERWFAWYQGHMDANGYVTDYDLGPAPDYVETSTGDEDSTDAYAGTLLLALYQLQRQGTEGKVRLQAYDTLTSKAAAAVISTQQTDGLTWAKPSYQVKYLMDQAEAFAGLKAASKIARVFHDKALAKMTAAAAARSARASRPCGTRAPDSTGVRSCRTAPSMRRRGATTTPTPPARRGRWRSAISFRPNGSSPLPGRAR